METTQPPVTSPSAPTPKKGLGTGAKIGIGCGGLVLLVIVGIIIAVVMGAGKLKNFAEEAQKNPTRATATMMVSASMGNMEMVAEDDANKRYTVKEKKSGTMTTIYWSAKKNAPEVIPGDFSAIPAETATPAPDAGSEPVPVK
ncbi:MAG: hypothetical protein ABIT37_25450 [Luteolibacter sp.]